MENKLSKWLGMKTPTKDRRTIESGNTLTRLLFFKAHALDEPTFIRNGTIRS